MAVTKIWQVHERLDTLLDYVGNTDKTTNPDFEALANTLDYAQDSSKTEQHFFVTGINCAPQTAYESMTATYALNDKPLKVLAYHAYQSFAPGEVTARQAHEIGVKLAERMWGRDFQIVVGTHLNTGTFHNHFVVCSTSFVDGHRYHQCTAATKRLRDVSDELCRECNLSVIENPEHGKTKNHGEWYADKYGLSTWKDIIREDLDQAIAFCVSTKSLTYELKKMGYEVKWGKELSVRPPGKERFMRPARQLGEQYSMEGLQRLFDANFSDKGSRPRPVFKPDYKRQVLYKIFKNLKLKKGSIFWLQYHYRYHVFCHREAPRTHYVSPETREAVRKLKNLDRQVRLLHRQKIDTIEQLEAFRESVAEKVSILVKERASLYGKASRTKDPDGYQAYRDRIVEYNSLLKILRQELRDCKGIKERSLSGKFATREVERALHSSSRRQHFR